MPAALDFRREFVQTAGNIGGCCCRLFWIVEDLGIERPGNRGLFDDTLIDPPGQRLDKDINLARGVENGGEIGAGAAAIALHIQHRFLESSLN